MISFSMALQSVEFLQLNCCPNGIRGLDCRFGIVSVVPANSLMIAALEGLHPELSVR